MSILWKPLKATFTENEQKQFMRIDFLDFYTLKTFSETTVKELEELVNFYGDADYYLMNILTSERLIIIRSINGTFSIDEIARVPNQSRLKNEIVKKWHVK